MPVEISHNISCARRCRSAGLLPFLWVLLTAAIFGAPLVFAADSSVETVAPRPIGEAETAALQWVADYLDKGPESWWAVLSADAPLRALGKAAAHTEIQVRVGLPEHSTWTLLTPAAGSNERAVFHVEHASGMEDLIELVMVQEEGRWKLHKLLCLADSRKIDDLDLLLRGTALPPKPLPFSSVPPPWRPAAVPAGLLLILLLVAERRFRPAHSRAPASQPRSRLVAAALTTLLLAGCDLVTETRQELLSAFSDGESDQDTLPLEIMAPLRPLRTAVLAGRTFSTEEIVSLARQLDLQPGNREIAEAWLAQRLTVSGDLKEADRRLAELPDPSSRPLTELVRARSAGLQGRGREASKRYESALGLAPTNDLLRLEAALSQLLHRQEVDAEAALQMLSRSGSRLAEVYYIANRLATVQDRKEEADHLFHVAWNLQPLSRARLFENPLLSHAATRPGVFPLFAFSELEEPIVKSPSFGKRPLSVSPEAGATLLGGRLTLTFGAAHSPARLQIPGAAELAPPQTQVESATQAETREVEEAMLRLATLIEDVGRRERLAHPVRRRWAGLAAQALAKHHRWSEIVDLTRAIGDDPTGMAPDLVQWRAKALIAQGFEAEALRLVVNLAKDNLENNRRDPGVYYQLAQIFVDQGELDLALRLIDRADQISPLPAQSQWRRQIELDRELSDAYRTRETDHFRLHFPPQTGGKYPRHLGWVLEAEWRRLQKWIPTKLTGGRKIDVQLVPYRSFMAAYSSGVEVVGIYDGKVRVPLADIRSLDPLIVGIVSHELAHAMIDIKTDGNAPKWLHEGLASHIEMSQPGINPIPEMHRVNRDLSFAVIDPILAGFSEPQLVELAYSHAAWALHFIEAEHGVGGIHRLLDAFRKHPTTEAALKSGLGLDLASFDKTWRRWCLERAPRQWPTEMVRYEKAFDNLLELEGEDGLSEAEVAALVRRPETERTQPVAKPTGPDLATRVQAWHKVYVERSTPVKLELRSALQLVKGRQAGDMVEACRRLGDSVRVLAGDPVALKPPLPKTAKALKTAYSHFGAAATACKAGQLSRIDVEIQKATEALGRAHKDLARFEVQP